MGPACPKVNPSAAPGSRSGGASGPAPLAWCTRHSTRPERHRRHQGAAPRYGGRAASVQARVPLALRHRPSQSRAALRAHRRGGRMARHDGADPRARASSSTCGDRGRSVLRTGDEPTETGIDGHGSPDGPHPTHARDSFARALDATPADLALLAPRCRSSCTGSSRCTRRASCIATSSRRTCSSPTEPRVVLLDFGLVTDTDGDRTFESIRVAGTPAYMSPEQAAGLPLDAGQRLVQRRRDALRSAHRQTCRFRAPYLAGADAEAAHRSAAARARSSPASRRISTSSVAICCAAIRERVRPARRSCSGWAARTIAPAVVRHATSPVDLPFVGRERQLARAARGVRRERSAARRRRSACTAGPASARRRWCARSSSGCAKKCRARSCSPAVATSASRCRTKAWTASSTRCIACCRASAPQELEALLPRDIAAAEQLFPVLCDLGDVGARAAAASPSCPTSRSCAAARSRRCASCSSASSTARRSSSPSTTCSGATSTAPSC